jgi:6-phosphogluconolactonase/glucosamine-6-phosphate isomerase/deaminase
MIFYKLSSFTLVAQIIADKLTQHLSIGEKVFWLVTGGSAITIEVEVGKLIAHENTSKLTVALMDERFGPVGHPDSNWQQLLDAGFEIPGAHLIPILQDKDRAETTLEFAHALAETFANADYSLGLFGIGPDGHTAGILPGSPEINTSELAVSYADNEATQQFTPGVYRDKDRITMTAAAIAKLDEAIVCALGESKHLPLDKIEQDIPIEEQPAQALKRVDQLSIYNDYKGEKI